MAPSAQLPVEWTVRDNPERRRFEIDLGDAVAVAEEQDRLDPAWRRPLGLE